MENGSNKTGKTIGILLIIVGIYALLNRYLNFNPFSMSHLWPLFVLVPGVMFEWSYFSTKRNPGLLVPGGILTTLGCLFLFETNMNWVTSGYTWPVYILAPAIGLFQLYLFGTRAKSLLIPVVILTVVSVTCFLNITFDHFFVWINQSLVWPITLIVIGLLLLLGRGKAPNQNKY